MARTRGEHELLVEQAHTLEPVECFGVHERQHEVEAAVAQLAEQGEGDVLADRDRHTGVGACELGDQRCGVDGADRRDTACAYVRPLDAATADLSLLSSASERWGSGTGGRLVRAAEELISSRGVTTMQLELLVPKGCIHPEKERLRAWYTRLGYRVVRSAPFEEVAAHLEPRLATPCEFLILRKRLGAG